MKRTNYVRKKCAEKTRKRKKLSATGTKWSWGEKRENMKADNKQRNFKLCTTKHLSQITVHGKRTWPANQVKQWRRGSKHGKRKECEKMKWAKFKMGVARRFSLPSPLQKYPIPLPTPVLSMSL